MGKYKDALKCVQIRRLVEEKKYKKALELVEAMEVSGIHALPDLKVVADVFMKTEQFDKAKEIYLKIYDKLRTRRVLYRLIILSIRSGNLQEAETYYREYLDVDAQSSDRLILRYRLDKAIGVGRKELITTLEALKKEEYMEEWAYELAKLYHKEGMQEECIRECSDIVLWFGEGDIVQKAKLLKGHYSGELDLSLTQNLQEVLKNQISYYMQEPKEQEQQEPKEPQSRQEDSSEEIPVTKEEVRIESMEKNRAKAIRFTSIKSFRESFDCSEGSVHFIIAGEEEQIIIALVKKISRMLKENGYFVDTRIARIQADKLNEINFDEKIRGLKGGCVLVEHAGDLLPETITKLTNMMQQFEQEIVVIFTDKKEKLDAILRDEILVNKISHFLAL